MNAVFPCSLMSIVSGSKNHTRDSNKIGARLDQGKESTVRHNSQIYHVSDNHIVCLVTFLNRTKLFSSYHHNIIKPFHNALPWNYLDPHTYHSNFLNLASIFSIPLKVTLSPNGIDVNGIFCLGTSLKTLASCSSGIGLTSY